MKEVWKDIQGYECKYKVSNLGRVKSLSRNIWGGKVFYKTKNRILKLKTELGYKEYQKVSLRDGYNTKQFQVHRLVAEAFIKNVNNKPCVNHKDGNRLNNNKVNLEWCTYSENNKHAWDIGLKKESKMKGEKHGMAKLKEKQIIMIRNLYKCGLYSYAKIAKIYNVDSSLPYLIVKRKIWKNIK